MDLWLDDGPAPPAYLSAQPQCSGSPYPEKADGCAYEDDLFAAHVLNAVTRWQSGRRPLFVYWAFHAVHSCAGHAHSQSADHHFHVLIAKRCDSRRPYQVPQDDYDAFAFIRLPERRAYHAMVARMDRHIGMLADILQQRSMWKRTLVVFSSDNGGPITQAANNYPLRGGQGSGQCGPKPQPIPQP